MFTLVPAAFPPLIIIKIKNFIAYFFIVVFIIDRIKLTYYLRALWRLLFCSWLRDNSLSYAIIGHFNHKVTLNPAFRVISNHGLLCP